MLFRSRLAALIAAEETFDVGKEFAYHIDGGEHAERDAGCAGAILKGVFVHGIPAPGEDGPANNAGEAADGWRTPAVRRRPSSAVGTSAPVAWSRIVKPLYPSSPSSPLPIVGPSTTSVGSKAAPQVPATQWTGHVPPSFAKWGVTAGWRSCV